MGIICQKNESFINIHMHLMMYFSHFILQKLEETFIDIEAYLLTNRDNWYILERLRIIGDSLFFQWYRFAIGSTAPSRTFTHVLSHRLKYQISECAHLCHWNCDTEFFKRFDWQSYYVPFASLWNENSNRSLQSHLQKGIRSGPAKKEISFIWHFFKFNFN